jgi:DNA-binding NarL/FixJ family response regulator
MDFEIRQNRTTAQGRRRLTREREAFLVLIAQGVSSQQACRIVGVCYMTGYRWRHGRPAGGGQPALAPITAATSSAAPGRYLNQQERLQIADLHRERAGVRQIAAELGRDPATISRELRRNAHPVSGKYRGTPATPEDQQDCR